MAAIAGVTVGSFAKLDIPKKQYAVSIGIAFDGSGKRATIGTDRQTIKIILTGKTQALAESIFTALEGDADGVVAIAPDSHVNLGNGAGVAISALWIDKEKLMTYRNFDLWDIELNFQYVS